MRKNVICRVVLVLFALLFIFPMDIVQASEGDAPAKKNLNPSCIQNFSTDYILTGGGPTDMISVAFAQLGKKGV